MWWILKILHAPMLGNTGALYTKVMQDLLSFSINSKSLGFVSSPKLQTPFFLPRQLEVAAIWHTEVGELRHPGLLPRDC